MSATMSLLRPSPDDLALAPELGVLAAVDATLATAAYQLHVEHPPLGIDSWARGYIPSTLAHMANSLALRFADLRLAIRTYRNLATQPDPADQLDLPF